MRSATN